MWWSTTPGIMQQGRLKTSREYQMPFPLPLQDFFLVLNQSI